MLIPALLAFGSVASALPQGLPQSLSPAPLVSSDAVDAPSASVPFVPSASVPTAPSAVPSAIPVNGPYTGGDCACIRALIYSILFSFSFPVTFYNPGSMGLTACGQKHEDTDPIAALPAAFFNNYQGATANPNINPLCGRQIVISASPTVGAPVVNVTATVADICGDCNITTSVDITPVLFDQIASQDVGRLHNITWDWLPGGAVGSSAGPGVPSGASMPVGGASSLPVLGGSVTVMPPAGVTNSPPIVPRRRLSREQI
ncbi:hypothetical protein C8R43DRAFT_881337 [Mycena crocata]|nr:hypothetical protein C8R43DRAFT_881337 [Mycena crocata]